MQQTEEETAKKSSAAQPKIIETTIKNYCEHNYLPKVYMLDYLIGNFKHRLTSSFPF